MHQRTHPWTLAPFKALACLAITIGSSAAPAQDAVQPGRSYYATIEELYSGEYRQAERGFQSEARGGISIGRSKWIDSICYRAMLGETYFQMGNPRQALAEFNAACELYLSNPKWLLSVEFQNPRVDNNSNRRIAPWGSSPRRPQYGVFSDTFLVRQGEFLTEQRLQQGGALQSPQKWPVRGLEILRTTALAIRRRNEILGPLGAEDRMSKSLRDVLARGDNTQRNHWSTAWTELLLGLAQQGVGETQQALVHLNRATLVDGRLDHPLTGAALLAQSDIALGAGNAKAALDLAIEAGYAAYAYEDYDVVAASFELAHRAWMAGGGTGAMPTLAAAAAWADRENLDHIQATIHITLAEQLASAGDVQNARAQLGNIPSRQRDLQAGRLAPIWRYVEAYTAYLDGNATLGDKAITDAIALSRGSSLRNFQIVLANQRVDAGQISSRVAVEVYANLLREPTGDDWAHEPLETITNLATSHEPSFSRWMLAALARKEVLPALDIADSAKRRRFWFAQPIGGRLLAIRYLLEADPSRLPPEAAVERRNLLLRVPSYEPLHAEAAELRRSLEAQPLADASGRMAQGSVADMKRLAQNASQREALVRRLVLGRDPTAMLLPPPVTATEVQSRLEPGQAVLVFHETGGALYGFILVKQGQHFWQLPDAAPLAAKVSEMLREMGHFNQNRTVDARDATLEAWQPIARQFGDMVLGGSMLDLSQTTELIVVPDSVLWHVPLEALMPTIGSNTELVIDRTPVRYVPTMGHTAADRIRPRPIRASLVAAPQNTTAGDYLSQQAVEELAATAAGAVVIDSPLPVESSLVAGLVEQLIVLADTELDPAKPYAFTPLPYDRSATSGTLTDWLQLPLPGCERLVLGGVHTVAEMGLKARSRGRSDNRPPPGSELFHTSCALLASGAKTVLISRWRTGGKTERDLLREFVLEVPHEPAAEAWRRSVALARHTNMDAQQEPRLKNPAEGSEPVPPGHPFFWSGFLLVDTGFDPTPTAPPAAEPPAEGPPAAGAPQAQAPPQAP